MARRGRNIDSELGVKRAVDALNFTQGDGMKELLLFRHAKAEPGAASTRDHERPINEKGKRQARDRGAAIAAANLLPDYIASSDATRATQTVRESVGTMRYTGKVDYLPALYDAEPATYRALLQKQPDGVQRLMIVGHNPSIEAFASELTSKTVHMKTGTVVRVVLDLARWNMIGDDTLGRLAEVFGD